MWKAILNLIPLALQAFNTIAGWFKKTPQGEREKIENANKKKEDEFEKTGRPK